MRRLATLPVLAAVLAAIAAIAVLSAPTFLSPWGVSQLGFIATYIVAGTGLMLLAGLAGQLSLCHAAFIGVGAYAEALLQARGVPLLLSLPLAALAAAATGLLAAWPVRRLGGVYLAIATLSFGFVVQEVLARWESVTGGNTGLTVAVVEVYWPAWGLALAALWLYGRLETSRLGRAAVALREDAQTAAVLGVAAARLKLTLFALAAALGGLAGALTAHQIRFVSPEQFGWVLSIELLMMLVIGGLGRRSGIVLGAVFLIVVPQALGALRDALGWTAPPAGLELFAFGLALALTLRFAPAGLATTMPGLFLRGRP